MKIVFQPPEQMNLLGYILSSLLERSLQNARNAKRLRRIKRPIELSASGMRLQLHCRGEQLILHVPVADEEGAKPAARVSGELAALLELALRKGMLGNFLKGRLHLGGRVWRLLPLFFLLRAREQA